MKRLDAAIVPLGLPFVIIGWQVAEKAEGRFIAVMTTVAAVLAGLALNHTIPRAPKLVVSYRNPEAGGRPVVWGDPGRAPHLEVWVENRGRGPARAVEVEFDALNVAVFNESGNMPSVDISVSPPRFMAGERVLGPDQHWVIGILHAIRTGWSAGTARWSARADGMEEQTGEVEITLLHGPPE